MSHPFPARAKRVRRAQKCLQNTSKSARFCSKQLETTKFDKILQKNLKIKEVKDEVIAPFSTLHRVLFVKQGEVPENLHLSLIDLKDLQPLEYCAKIST